MKQLICVLLVVLTLVGSGAVVAADEKATKYPGEVHTGAPWEETLVDGHHVRVEVWVWDPVTMGQEYAHPANGLAQTNYMVRTYEGYNGTEAWAIPFAVRTTNLTVGLGGVSHILSIGVMKNILTTQPWDDNGYVTIAGIGYYDEDKARNTGLDYFLPILFTGTGKEKFADLISEIGSEGSNIVVFRERIEKYYVDCPAMITIALDEGESKFTLGCFVFVDRLKTLDSPHGLTAEEFQQAIIAVGVQPKKVNPRRVYSKMIVGMGKDEDGNVVFDREMNILQ